MPKTKPPYPEAFKQQIVELHMAGRTPAELSREFGVSAQSITAWVARAAADVGNPARGKDVLSTAERDELARLRRRVRQLEQERDILAKATAWFAGKDGKTDQDRSAPGAIHLDRGLVQPAPPPQRIELPVADELRDPAHQPITAARRTRVAHHRRLRGMRHAAGGQPCARALRKG